MKGLIFGAGLAATAALGLPAISSYFFRTTIVRKKDQGTGPDRDTGTDWEQFFGLIDERREWLLSQNPEPVSIRSNDGLLLKGIYVPAKHQPARRLVLCHHGYMSRGLNDYPSLSPLYHNMGYDMLIVDNRAHGDSEGQYIGFGALDRYDCKNWIAYAIARFGPSIEITLHGISMGASTVLMASNLNLPENVKGIVADCGFTSAWDVFAHILKRDYHLPPFPLMHMTSAICQKKAGYRFDECSTLDAVRRTNVPILFIHGEKDDFVPTQMGRSNYAACASEKQLLIIKDAGHAASYYFDPEAYENAVQEFLAKC